MTKLVQPNVLRTYQSGELYAANEVCLYNGVPAYTNIALAQGVAGTAGNFTTFSSIPVELAANSDNQNLAANTTYLIPRLYAGALSVTLPSGAAVGATVVVRDTVTISTDTGSGIAVITSFTVTGDVILSPTGALSHNYKAFANIDTPAFPAGGEMIFTRTTSNWFVSVRYGKYIPNRTRIINPSVLYGFTEFNNSEVTSNQIRTMIFPDANVNLGDLPSVATTNINILTGAKSAIVAGNNNTLSGTDGVITGSEYSSIAVGNSNCFIAGSRRAGIDSTGDKNSIYSALGGNTVYGAYMDTTGSRNIIFGSLCADNTAMGTYIAGTASDNFVFGARANYTQYTILNGSTTRCTVVSSGGGITLNNCNDSVLIGIGGSGLSSTAWTSTQGVIQIGRSLPVSNPANTSSYYGVGSTGGNYSAEFRLYNATAATNLVLTTNGSGTIAATNAPNIESGANTYDIDIYLLEGINRVAVCRRKVFVNLSFAFSNAIDVQTVGTDLTWGGNIPTITITIDATTRLKVSCSATTSGLDPLSLTGSAFVSMKSF